MPSKLSLFLAELRRRRVYHVFVAYVVVGSLLGGVANDFLPRLGAPEWATAFVIVLIVMGLPMALVLAWAYEVRPEEPRGAETSREEPAAREILQELLALADERYVSAKWIGYVYMGLGEDDRALQWFERAVDDRADWIVWINLLPGIDRYGSNPRFQEILRSMNLPIVNGEAGL